MRSLVAVVLLAGCVVLVAAGCAPVDEEWVAYGGSNRAGIAVTTLPPARTVTDGPIAFLVTGELGFDAASGFEVDYALPLARGFDLRIAVGSTSWAVAFPAGWIPAGDAATWNTTSLMFLLTGGARWGRLGFHVSAGPGWFFNGLDWPAHTTTADGSLAQQFNFGLTFMAAKSVELGLEAGYRASRAVYSWDGNGHDQMLDSALVKFGVHILF